MNAKTQADRTDGFFLEPPTIGMKYSVRGSLGTITRVYPLGTIDVEMPSGNYVRVTGLPFL